MTLWEKLLNWWERFTHPSQKGGPPVCTYCGGTEWYEGPSGGMSTNIRCANPECRHWFNWHQGIIPMEDLHRVEPPEK